MCGKGKRTVSILSFCSCGFSAFPKPYGEMMGSPSSDLHKHAYVCVSVYLGDGYKSNVIYNTVCSYHTASPLEDTGICHFLQGGRYSGSLQGGGKGMMEAEPGQGEA